MLIQFNGNLLEFTVCMEKFTDLIKDNSNCTLLLGNGFSISLHKEFDYQVLLEVAQGTIDHKLSDESKKIFDSFKTQDFEKVLFNLDIASKVVEHYNCQNLKETIDNDLSNIRCSFIESISYIHPANQANITNEIKHKVRRFLSNFTKIFTTNYDIMLY